jgi:hypothetical protein
MKKEKLKSVVSGGAGPFEIVAFGGTEILHF